LSASREQLRHELDSIVLDSPPDESDPQTLIGLFEALLDAGESFEELIARYCREGEPATTRALSFVLARQSSNGPDRARLRAPVYELAERVRHDDATSRMNLLAALQLLAAYDSLLAAGEYTPEILARIVLAALAGSAAEQSASLTLLRALYSCGLASRLGPELAAALPDRLGALSDSDDELVRSELESLTDLIERE
jgi:hypothetical protein